MASEPMSDERLAEIRACYQTIDSALPMQHELDIRALLSHIDMLEGARILNRNAIRLLKDRLARHESAAGGEPKWWAGPCVMHVRVDSECWQCRELQRAHDAGFAAGAAQRAREVMALPEMQALDWARVEDRAALGLLFQSDERTEPMLDAQALDAVRKLCAPSDGGDGGGV